MDLPRFNGVSYCPIDLTEDQSEDDEKSLNSEALHDGKDIERTTFHSPEVPPDVEDISEQETSSVEDDMKDEQDCLNNPDNDDGSRSIGSNSDDIQSDSPLETDLIDLTRDDSEGNDEEVHQDQSNFDETEISQLDNDNNVNNEMDQSPHDESTDNSENTTEENPAYHGSSGECNQQPAEDDYSYNLQNQTDAGKKISYVIDLEHVNSENDSKKDNDGLRTESLNCTSKKNISRTISYVSHSECSARDATEIRSSATIDSRIDDDDLAKRNQNKDFHSNVEPDTYNAAINDTHGFVKERGKSHGEYAPRPNDSSIETTPTSDSNHLNTSEDEENKNEKDSRKKEVNDTNDDDDSIVLLGVYNSNKDTKGNSDNHDESASVDLDHPITHEENSVDSLSTSPENEKKYSNESLESLNPNSDSDCNEYDLNSTTGSAEHSQNKVKFYFGRNRSSAEISISLAMKRLKARKRSQNQSMEFIDRNIPAQSFQKQKFIPHKSKSKMKHSGTFNVQKDERMADKSSNNKESDGSTNAGGLQCGKHEKTKFVRGSETTNSKACLKPSSTPTKGSKNSNDYNGDENRKRKANDSNCAQKRPSAAQKSNHQKYSDEQDKLKKQKAEERRQYLQNQAEHKKFLQMQQERLFQEAARRAQARLHHENLLKIRSEGQTFFYPVENVKELPEEHWKWKNLYSRLGLPEKCNPILIKKQYRKLALIYHPDKGGCSIRFNAIREAYESLLN